jgi:hypothetical protein
MHNKIIIVAIAALLVFLGTGVPVAQAVEKCSLHTMTGTYVFNERGSSLIANPLVQPFPVHMSAALAPFVTVGEVTFNSDGVGNGFYWIRVGSLSGGLDATAVQVTIIEMNEDCTGKFRYSIHLPGSSSATIVEERFVVFDNGREYRSVPTFIDETGVPTLAWIGTGRRVSKPGEQVKSCGPQTVHGTYLITAENIVEVDPTTAFADTIVFRVNISMTGDYTGMLFEKLGPVSVELPVFGTFTTNPDCSFSWSLNVTGITTAPIQIRGVFFEGGKEFYSLAIESGIDSSFAQGMRIRQ